MKGLTAVFLCVLLSLCSMHIPATAAKLTAQEETKQQTSSALEQCKARIKQVPPQASLGFCSQQFKILDIDKYPIVAAKLQLTLYDIYQELGDKVAAEQMLDEVKNSAAFTQNVDIQYLWLRKKAAEKLYRKSYQEAKTLFEQAFSIAKTQESDIWLAKSYNDLALTEQYLNQYDKALSYYQKSLAIKEALGNDFNTAITLNNLGLIYKKLEKFKESQRYFELSLEHYLRYTSHNVDIHVIGYMSHLYGNLAEIYNINNQFNKKNFYSNKVIEAYNDNLVGDDRLSALINVATIHINANEFTPALDVANTLSEYLTRDDHSFHDVIFYLKAQIATHQKDATQAIKFIESAMDYSDTKQDSLQKMNIYHYASELYYDNGRPYESLVYLKKYQQLHETLLEKKYSENIKVIQSDIENERVQRALAEEQIVSQQKSQKIDKLLNLILGITSVGLLVGFIVSFYIYRKRKAQQHLMTIIESHKQQLFLLSNDDTAEQDDAQQQESTPLSPSELTASFAELLVNTMIDCISIWEKSTKTNKVELADRSQIWTISIDSGRLRTRSLDKYLQVKKLPANPRWRNVVKTCHFILSECNLSNDDRTLLTSHLDRIMQVIKSESLETT
ncbi:tetratricopeptide repeat protein [Shewanella sp. SR44-4]|uniref:tetratricopeptide repeat protein n=1 Tax=unclassified Shewanella TaxID=196818 RepID=UPI000C31E5A6|nr:MULTISPECIES: tetratricopeptide repeat protein [unclassified Shewanella]MBB1362431.1 tetratricopeptide repeat protein [Shewanella sp. SR44-4]PKH31125.1 tetratricopeptide repeat-containing protein [Shewanella sp. ALD9]